jgi:hypothetical protein
MVHADAQVRCGACARGTAAWSGYAVSSTTNVSFPEATGISMRPPLFSFKDGLRGRSHEMRVPESLIPVAFHSPTDAHQSLSAFEREIFGPGADIGQNVSLSFSGDLVAIPHESMWYGAKDHVIVKSVEDLLDRLQSYSPEAFRRHVGYIDRENTRKYLRQTGIRVAQLVDKLSAMGLNPGMLCEGAVESRNAVAARVSSTMVRLRPNWFSDSSNPRPLDDGCPLRSVEPVPCPPGSAIVAVANALLRQKRSLGGLRFKRRRIARAAGGR